WPGNVRELENVLERAVILAGGDAAEIGPDLLPLSAPAPAAGQPPAPPDSLPAVPQLPAGERPLSLEAVERNYILSVLQQTDGVITGPRGAAKVLDLNPSPLRYRIKKLGITRFPPHPVTVAAGDDVAAAGCDRPPGGPSPLRDGSRS